jgi:restriction endonuclease Mrr
VAKQQRPEERSKADDSQEDKENEPQLAPEERAEAIIAELLAEELLALTSSYDGESLTSLVIEVLESGGGPAELAAALEDAPAVAELFASDEDLARVMASFARA